MPDKDVCQAVNHGPSADFLVFGQPQILEGEIEEVVACLRSGWIGTGPRVARFERDFAEFKGVAQAAAVSSCSAALHVSLRAAGIQAGDEVITSPMTFCGTVNAIIHAGGHPVLADVEPGTGNLDVREMERRITARTRAVIPVHFAGRPAAMDSLCEIAQRRGLKVIEDCAHAIEGEYHGRATGTLGDFGCFSFYATKNATTGEGGMVVALREADLDRIKRLALHGLNHDAWHRFQDSGYKHYLAVDVGFKYNMTDLEASLGIHQLSRLRANWLRRQAIWSRYMDSFSDLPLTLPAAPEPDTRHAFHLYTVLVDEHRTGVSRDEFLTQLATLGVGTGVHYLSIAEHPVYRERYGWRPEEWPVAHEIGRQTASLPLGPGLTDQDVERVIAAVRRVLRR